MRVSLTNLIPAETSTKTKNSFKYSMIPFLLDSKIIREKLIKMYLNVTFKRYSYTKF